MSTSSAPLFSSGSQLEYRGSGENSWFMKNPFAVDNFHVNSRFVIGSMLTKRYFFLMES